MTSFRQAIELVSQRYKPYVSLPLEINSISVEPESIICSADKHKKGMVGEEITKTHLHRKPIIVDYKW